MSRKDVQHTDIDPSIESTHGFILLQVHVVSTLTYRAKRVSNNVITARRHTRAGTNCYIGL